MVWLFVAYGAAIGACLGSFLTVVWHRLPRGLSVVRPGSACPACGHPIRKRHNIPVLGWLLLQGRCFDCASAIPARYPLLEVIWAAVGAGVAYAGWLAAGAPTLLG